MKGACREARERLSVRNCSDRTGSNVYELKEGFSLDIRKKFFTLRVVRHWNRLIRKVVAALSLSVFKAGLDKALSNLV